MDFLIHSAHINNVLKCENVKNVSYLFLVGGFSESQILQKKIRDSFSSTLKVIIPQGVSLAILRGAVLFGLDPSIVHVRRSRLTYGFGVLNRFIPGVHPEEKLILRDGYKWCADIFDKFVVTDQSVPAGDAVVRSYAPALREGQKCTVIHIYCSERDDVNFITDEGVRRCGTLLLDLEDEPIKLETITNGSNWRDSKPHTREIRTKMTFGDTEVKVTAEDVVTGRCVKAEIEFYE